MENCIFCKIIKGEIPSFKVYEDNNVFAFLDIAPVNKGHVLVIPKNHSENIHDVSDEDLKHLISAAKNLSDAVKKGVGADGVNVSNSSGIAAGQTVMHTHFHIIPRFKGDGLKHWPQGKYGEGEMQKYAELIKTANVF